MAKRTDPPAVDMIGRVKVKKIEPPPDAESYLAVTLEIATTLSVPQIARIAEIIRAGNASFAVATLQSTMPLGGEPVEEAAS